MMRRKALWICSIMVTLALLPAINPVQATPSVSQLKWVDTVYSGLDDYHSAYVIAYKAGTNARLIVQVYNDFPKTDFTVYVHMDWATTNVTSSAEVPQNQWYTFDISISIPETVNINLLHSYRILVRYIDRTTTPGTERWLGPYTPPYLGLYYFAVYSAEQVDSQQLLREYTSWRNAYTSGGVTYMGTGFVNTSRFRELWAKGAIEKSLGDESYRTGGFSDAKTHYGNALNYTVNAITSDVEKTATLEDAVIGLLDANRSLLSMQGYAFIIASIGFLFIGIGAMIYLIRRSAHPKV